MCRQTIDRNLQKHLPEGSAQNNHPLSQSVLIFNCLISEAAIGNNSLSFLGKGGYSRGTEADMWMSCGNTRLSNIKKDLSVIICPIPWQLKVIVIIGTTVSNTPTASVLAGIRETILSPDSCLSD